MQEKIKNIKKQWTLKHGLHKNFICKDKASVTIFNTTFHNVFQTNIYFHKRILRSVFFLSCSKLVSSI